MGTTDSGSPPPSHRPAAIAAAAAAAGNVRRTWLLDCLLSAGTIVSDLSLIRRRASDPASSSRSTSSRSSPPSTTSSAGGTTIVPSSATMATVEHCLFCFETLTAHLEDRERMSLAEVQKSWTAYLKATSAGAGAEGSTAGHGKLAKQLPALRRLAAASSSSGFSSPSSASSTTSLQQPSSGSENASGVATPATSLSSLGGAAEEDEGEDADDAEEVTESPMFITWNIDTPRHGYILRGCIGTFESQELEEGLSSYALTSALHDTRFSPIVARELPSLEVAVTLLTDFEDAVDPMDWELGTHGLRISFYYHGRRYGATYLPDVAPEQGWTQEETVVSLMRKAGWMGHKSKWHEVELKVVRYQGRKESLEYAEFKQWRDWVDKQQSGSK